MIYFVIGLAVFSTVVYFLLLIGEAFKIRCYRYRFEKYNAAYVLLFLTSFRKWRLYCRALYVKVEPFNLYKEFNEHEEDFFIDSTEENGCGLFYKGEFVTGNPLLLSKLKYKKENDSPTFNFNCNAPDL